MQRTDSVKWERTLDFICVVVFCYVSGREGQEWRSDEVALPFLSPSPTLLFTVGCGGDWRLVGFLALRPPTSDSVRIRVSPKWETSGANESTFFFGD